MYFDEKSFNCFFIELIRTLAIKFRLIKLNLFCRIRDTKCTTMVDQYSYLTYFLHTV